MTENECRLVVEHAVRWASNILCEVLSNHGKVLPDVARDNLKTAITCLSEAARQIFTREGQGDRKRWPKATAGILAKECGDRHETGTRKDLCPVCQGKLFPGEYIDFSEKKAK